METKTCIFQNKEPETYLIVLENNSDYDEEVNMFKTHVASVNITILKKIFGFWTLVRPSAINQTLGMFYICSENADNLYQTLIVDGEKKSMVLDPHCNQAGATILRKEVTSDMDFIISVKAKSSIVLNAFPIDENKVQYKAPTLVYKL